MRLTVYKPCLDERREKTLRSHLTTTKKNLQLLGQVEGADPVALATLIGEEHHLNRVLDEQRRIGAEYVFAQNYWPTTETGSIEASTEDRALLKHVEHQQLCFRDSELIRLRSLASRALRGGYGEEIRDLAESDLRDLSRCDEWRAFTVLASFEAHLRSSWGEH